MGTATPTPTGTACANRNKPGARRMKPRFGRIEEVNKELWLLLSLFGICLLLNLAVDGQRMVLSFYTLPTLGLGVPVWPATRDADGARQRPARLPDDVVQPGALRAATADMDVSAGRWLDITVWGGVLIVTGYSMGTLYDHRALQINELRANLSRRADDPASLHRQGHLHRESLVSRVGVRGDDCDRARSAAGPRRGRPRRRRCCTTSASWTSAASCSTRRRG